MTCWNRCAVPSGTFRKISGTGGLLLGYPELGKWKMPGKNVAMNIPVLVMYVTD